MGRSLIYGALEMLVILINYNYHVFHSAQLSSLLSRIPDVARSIVAGVIGIGRRNASTDEEKEEELGLVASTLDTFTRYLYADESSD